MIERKKLNTGIPYSFMHRVQGKDSAQSRLMHYFW